jgi:hypothetical protein
MFGRFKRARQETAIREALTAEFGKQGLDFASFDPTIQRTMVMAALASGSVQKQVEASPAWRRRLPSRMICPTSLSANWVRAYAEFGQRMEKKTGSP